MSWKLWRCYGHRKPTEKRHTQGVEPVKREKCVTVNKAERSWRSEDLFDIRHGYAEFGVYLAYFHSCFVPEFPLYVLFPPFQIRNINLYHYMLEVCDLNFGIDLKVVIIKRCPRGSETLNFGYLNRAETMIHYRYI